MIELAPLLKVFPIFVAALVSPGPDFMIVSSMSLQKGRMAGVKAAAGIATGVLFYVVLSLLGLAALLEHLRWLSIGVKIAGGVYLAYLGAMLWKASASAPAAAAPPTRAKDAYVAGLLTNLTNPKAIAFFASVFAVALTSSSSPRTKLVLVAGSGALTFAWFSLVAVTLSNARLQARYRRASKIIDRGAGSLLLLLGVKLALSAT